LESAAGIIDPKYPHLFGADIPFIRNNESMFHSQEEISGSIVDEYFMPEGFVLELPIAQQAIVDNQDKDKFSVGIPQQTENMAGTTVYEYDSIFIPNSMTRRCWRHSSGKWGLSRLGMYVNHIVECCHNFVAEESPKNTIALHRSVVNYFRFVSSCMGTKFGDISNIGMSIRYPFSSRAVAVVDEHLPKNHVEIHQDMARELMVSDGDVILAERFPCLGFVSVRPQYVKVTQDPMCKYTVRVSGNSLNSMNLDLFT
jgi:hypothetical protein